MNRQEKGASRRSTSRTARTLGSLALISIRDGKEAAEAYLRESIPGAFKEIDAIVVVAPPEAAPVVHCGSCCHGG